MKEHKKCAANVQSEVDTIKEENNRLLDQAKMIQKEKSYIIGDLSNMVANHVRS